MTGNVAPVRRGREGSRWFNERPDSKEIADWFRTVPLHEGMDHDRYIGGIVLIEQKIKTDEIVGYDKDGRPQIATRQNRDVDNRVTNLVYTPYPKVETRVQYFWDLMAQHPNWLGVIEPVGGDPNLGPGFSKRVFRGVKNGKAVDHVYVTCSMRVAVYERDSYEERWFTPQPRPGDRIQPESRLLRSGKTVIAGAPATKMVPVNTLYGGVDDFAMMKAETGAVGRALGMAGMLVVPGAGVATAEDMQEAASLEQAPPQAVPQAEAASLPQEQEKQPSEDDPDALRSRAKDLIGAIKAEFPDAYAAFQEWAKGRNIESLEKSDVLALKGIVKKAEKVLDDARVKAAEKATAEALGDGD